jgi:hypothetical protein
MVSDLPKSINSAKAWPHGATSPSPCREGVLYHTMARGNNGRRYFWEKAITEHFWICSAGSANAIRFISRPMF